MLWMIALGWQFAESFLKFWLGIKYLELWLRMEGKHLAIPSCGLMILVTGMSAQVVPRTDGLHLIRKS